LPVDSSIPYIAVLPNGGPPAFFNCVAENVTVNFADPNCPVKVLTM